MNCGPSKKQKQLVHNSSYVNDIKINGVVEFVDSYKNAVKFLGEPDSTVTISDQLPDFHNIEQDNFKNITFEKFWDSLVFKQIDFRRSKANYLQTGDIKLDGTVTLEQFEKLFPTTKDKELKGTDQDICQMFELDLSPQSNKSWLFSFDTNTRYLYKVECITQKKNPQ